MKDSGQACVAVVTGASRGAGRGIALALGAAGATVYVTGRTEQEGSAPLPGTIHATAREVDALGGRGIAVACDHADDAQVADGVQPPSYRQVLGGPPPVHPAIVE